MSTGTRLPLVEAEQLATELMDLLRPACERIAVAGSIRRRKADVGDIELICIPRLVTVENGADLFGNVQTETYNALTQLTFTLLYDGTLRYRLNKHGQRSWGEQLKWGLYKDFAVDIYSATPETWAVTMLIRTGPAEFSHRLATGNYGGSGEYGLCPPWLHLKGWRYVHAKDGIAYDTPTEESVFNLLGWEYLPPEQRTDTAIPKARATAATA